MASRVNVKFVVLLATVLVLGTAGTAVLAYRVVYKSPAQLASKGDAKLAEGEIRAAELLYSKAVNKDPYNSIYLLKWRGALERLVPETDQELQNEFTITYRQLLSQLALSDGMSSSDFQAEYLDLMSQWFADQGFSRPAREAIVNDATRYIDHHESAGSEPAAIAQLKRLRGQHLAAIVRQGLDLTAPQTAMLQSDLDAALTAFPDDYEALESLVVLRQQQAASADLAGRITESERLAQEADAAIRAFVEANGQHSRAGVLARMLATQGEFVAAQRATIAKFGDRANPELEKLAAEFQLVTEQIAQAVAALEPAQRDARLMRRLYALESQTNRARDFRATLGPLQDAIAQHPGDLSMKFLLAEIHSARREFDQAVATLEPLLPAERLPIGLAAWQRINARLMATATIANYSLIAQAATEDETSKRQWIERAKAARAQLSQLVAGTAPAIQMLDAKLALAENDLAAAQKLLDEYNSKTNNADSEALWLTAQVAQSLRNLGKARDALQQLLVLSPGLASAHTALANVELQLNHPETSLEHLRQAQKAHPDDADLQAQIRELELRLDPSTADDPITRAVYEARRIAAGSETEIADPAAGIARLNLALQEHGDRLELYREITRFQLLSNDLDGATETIQAGLALYPADEDLTRYQGAITASNSVDARVELIQASDDTEIEKAINTYAAYAGEGRTAEADEALARAQAINPVYPRLLEVRFNRASAANDLEEARRITEQATNANADRLNGLSFRSRLLMLEGRNEEALAALSQAVQIEPNSVNLWQLLGNLQLRLGQNPDALTSFQRALTLRPNDIPAAMDYCVGLISLNRYTDALEVARRTEVAGRSDPRFMELLLGLEAQVGDKEAARARREKILEATPTNLANRNALIELYITLGRRAEATQLIQQTRDQFGPSPTLVQLEARWHAEGNDLESARRVFARDIAETPPAERAGKLVALAQFMLSQSRSQNAIAALQQAVKYQPQGVHDIEVMLASTLMRFGRNEEAFTVLNTLLAGASGEQGRQITLQAAEALIGIDRLTDAERLLAALPNPEADNTVVLLRGRIQIKRGDGPRARAMLDDAVTRWPNDHRVWVLRAEAESMTPDLYNDALADLQQAITLRPDLAEAHRRKAELLAELGREDEAIAAWREAVRFNPTLEDLRAALLSTMIQRGLETDAIVMAEEWFAVRPHDVGLRTRVGERFLSGGMYDAAVQVYQDAFQIDQQPQVLLRLVDLLLGAEPPRAIEAERAMAEAKTVVSNDAALLLGRARIFVLTNRMQAALNDCNSSFKVASRKADFMAFWFSTLRGVFDDPQQTLTFLRSLAAEPGGQDWAPLFSARVMISEPATAEAGIIALQELLARTRDPEVLYSGLRALSGHLYSNGRFEEALKHWQRALTLRPGDWQIENNIAYALGTDLHRPEEALPFAESATKHAPNNPEVHDTLGAIYLALGTPEEALAPLEAAVRATRGTPADAKYMTRLAQARLAAGDRQGAQDLATQIQALLDRGRKLDDQYAAIFSEVREALDKP